MLSPSSPISAAVLYTNARWPSATRTEPEVNSGSALRAAIRRAIVGSCEVETVAGDEHVEAGGVAAADLEPVERRRARAGSSGTPRSRAARATTRRRDASTARAVRRRSRASAHSASLRAIERGVQRLDLVDCRWRRCRARPRARRRCAVSDAARCSSAASADRIGEQRERPARAPERTLDGRRSRRATSLSAADRRPRDQRSEARIGVVERARGGRAARARGDRSGDAPRRRFRTYDSSSGAISCRSSVRVLRAANAVSTARRSRATAASASGSVGASTMTRTTGSVPDARTSTRPDRRAPPRSTRSPRGPRSPTSRSATRATGTLTSTCGNRCHRRGERRERPARRGARDRTRASR